MKRFMVMLLTVLLVIGLSGCGSSKPSKDDVLESARSSISAFKDMGYDLQSYIDVDDVKITDSYKDGNFYIIKAIPHIVVKKDLTKEILKNKFGNSYVLKVVTMFEAIKYYKEGKMNKAQLTAAIGNGIPSGILKKGNEFDGLESTYKFRKTDNGWRGVN